MQCIPVTFSELKDIQARKKVAVQCQDTLNAIELRLIENGIEWIAVIWKDTEELYDPAVWSDYQAHKMVLRVGASVERRAEDGRMLVQPVTLDSHLWHRFTSFGDSAEHIGDGQSFSASINPGDENKIIQVSFRDWVQVTGGLSRYEGGEVSKETGDADWVSLRVLIPNAHALTPNATGTGNAMVFMNTVIPMPGNGLFDLDLKTANFVPADGYTGFWDWDWPDKFHGELRPNFTQKGEFHVITPDYSAVEFVGKSILLGSGTRNYTPPNPHPTYIYPGWVLEAEFHKISDGTKTSQVASELQTARKATI